MGKVVGKIATFTGLAIVAVATGGAFLAASSLGGIGFFGGLATTSGLFGLSLGGLAGLGLAVSYIGSGLVTRSKALKAARSARAQNLVAQVQPDAPAVWMFGETAMPLQVVYAENIDDEEVVQVLAGVAHEIDSFGQTYIEDETVGFSGNAATGAWAGALRRYTRKGTQTQTAISTAGSTWPTAARGKGFPHFLLKWNLRAKKLKERVPNRITQIGKGCLCYDPRKDGSLQGGVGDHRANDQATWEYSANWALIVLFYLLGWKHGNTTRIGMGVSPQDIDLQNFMDIANVCDQLVDGIPRYHIGGIMQIDGDHQRALGELEATVGGDVSKTGGQYRCWCPHDDLVPVASITALHIPKDAAVEHRPVGDLSELFNTAGGQYVEPDLKYQLDTYPDVLETAALEEDGKERFMALDTVYLQSSARAQRVARQQLRRSRFSESWVVPVTYELLNIKVYDVVLFTHKYTADQPTLCRVLQKVVTTSGIIVLNLLIEHPNIYDITAPLQPRNVRQAPNLYNADKEFAVINLAADAATVTGELGTQTEGLQVSWDAAPAMVRQTEVEYRPDGQSYWIPGPAITLTDAGSLIPNLEPGTLYEIRARHISIFDVAGEWAYVTALTLSNSVIQFFSAGDVIQNDWFNHGTLFWNFTAGWSRTVVERGGLPRNAMQHLPADDQYDYFEGRSGENRAVGSRLWNQPFDTFAGERIFITVYGPKATDADGELRIGIAFYDEHLNFISEIIHSDPIEVVESLGAHGRRFTTPPGAFFGEVFALIVGHSKGSWTLTGWAESRDGIASQDSVLDGGDAPAEGGATNGATIGSNVKDADGLVLSEGDLYTADGQLEFAHMADFKNSLLGWTVAGGTVQPRENGIQVSSTGNDLRISSPELVIDGTVYDRVAVRLKRVGAPVDYDRFESQKLYYRAGSEAWHEDRVVKNFRRVGDDSIVTLAFDMSGTSWKNGEVNQIRFDPSVTAGDVFEIDWIGVARVAPHAVNAVAGNLADGLEFVDFAAIDDDQADLFGVVDLAAVGLQVGDVVSAGCEILATGGRSGHLRLSFERADNSDIAVYDSAAAAPNKSTYQVVKLEGGFTIPSGCTKIRFHLIRQASPAGEVGARRLSLNRGSSFFNWYPVRSDVEEGANNTTSTSQLIDDAELGKTALWEQVAGGGALGGKNTVATDDIDDLSTYWTGGATLSTFTLTDGNTASIGGLISQPHARGGVIEFGWNPVVNCNVGSSEVIRIKFQRELFGGGLITLEEFDITVSNTKFPLGMVVYYRPADMAEVQATQFLVVSVQILDGSGSVTFDNAPTYMKENTK